MIFWNLNIFKFETQEKENTVLEFYNVLVQVRLATIRTKLGI